jgi:hypothetical protein
MFFLDTIMNLAFYLKKSDAPRGVQRNIPLILGMSKVWVTNIYDKWKSLSEISKFPYLRHKVIWRTQLRTIPDVALQLILSQSNGFSEFLVKKFQNSKNTLFIL